MSKQIFKYPLRLVDEQTLQVPAGSKFLSLIEQYGAPVMYFSVDSSEKKMDYYNIQIRGTGHEMPKFSKFVGTISTYEGRFMWHIFMLKEIIYR